MCHNDPGLQVQYRMTHYISGWLNGNCQTFAKGLFFLTKCSRGFRSVRLLVRRQLSAAASLSSSLPSCSKGVAGANSVNICCLTKTFQSFNICQRCCLTNWAIADVHDVGQDAFDVERMSTTTENVPKWIKLFAGRQIAFSRMEI